jgi:hypothetical protein
MENQNYEIKQLERELAGYKVTLRRTNLVQEEARKLYSRVRALETELN